jgi:hypothetical protein
MMISNASVISTPVLREFVGAGSVTSARIESAGDKGLFIVVRIGMNERVLGAFRGGVRYFQSFDGAISNLQSFGIMRCDVDSTHWLPKKNLARKSDESEAAEN